MPGPKKRFTDEELRENRAEYSRVYRAENLVAVRASQNELAKAKYAAMSPEAKTELAAKRKARKAEKLAANPPPPKKLKMTPEERRLRRNAQAGARRLATLTEATKAIQNERSKKYYAALGEDKKDEIVERKRQRRLSRTPEEKAEDRTKERPKEAARRFRRALNSLGYES